MVPVLFITPENETPFAIALLLFDHDVARASKLPEMVSAPVPAVLLFVSVVPPLLANSVPETVNDDPRAALGDRCHVRARGAD